MTDRYRIICADVMDGLAQLPDEHFHLCCTSPPYCGGVRDFDTATWEGGSDPECDHVQRAMPQNLAKLSDRTDPRTNPRNPNRQDTSEVQSVLYRDICGKCGAKRVDQQIGHEASPDEYVDRLVEVFGDRGVWRVMRPDGVVLINIGTGYNGSGHGPDVKAGRDNWDGSGKPTKVPGLKPGDDMLVPQRLALALQADGWTVRAPIVWAKGRSCQPQEEWAGSVMPFSGNGFRWERCRMKVEGGDRGKEPQRVGSTPERPQQDHDGKEFKPSAEYVDCPGCPKCAPNDGLVLREGGWRPTPAHEIVLMLTKSMRYVCDQEAVRELGRIPAGTKAAKGSGTRDGNRRPEEYAEYDGTRNLRDVWFIPTKGNKFKHYAAFPMEFAELMVRMGTSRAGCCSSCGASWLPVVETERSFESGSGRAGNLPNGKNRPGMQGGGETLDVRRGPTVHNRIVGWRPMCSCAPENGEEPLSPVPCRVLDPFVGSGTSGVACARLGRDFTGIDLNRAYVELAERRIAEEGYNVKESEPDEQGNVFVQESLLEEVAG